MMIQFIVYGEPVAKGRPRFARRGNFVSTYTPKKTKDAERIFQLEALQYKPKEILVGPLKIEIDVYRSIPKSASNKNMELMLKGLIRPISRPDCDNYEKLVLDAMNGIFWKDDSQICETNVRKWYSTAPRIEIKLSLLVVDC